MLSTRFIKVVSIILIFSMTAGFLFAQYDVIYETPEQPTPSAIPMPSAQSYSPGNAAQGAIDGANDAKGNMAYACGGFACGVLGFVFAALSEPVPDAAVMAQINQTKGSNYALAYQNAYSKQAKSKNILYAGLGWGAAVVVSLVYYASLLSEAETEEYKK